MTIASATEIVAAPGLRDEIVTARSRPADVLTAEIATLDAIPDHWVSAWDMLAVEASEPNAFAERWFIEASCHLAAPADDIRLVAVWGEQRLIGIIALAIAPRYGRIPVRNIQNWLHYHSFLGSPLIAAGWEAPFWRMLLDTLDRADWAPAFLHVNGLVADGPVHAGLAAARDCAVVHSSERALLQSALGPAAYYEQTVRKKKRKEINRLQSRLDEMGSVACTRIGQHDDLAAWCDEFLALERAGWKAGAGALANAPATEAFFRAAMAGAFAAGRLEIIRLALDGKAIAMLVNFITPPGAFGFKTAFDEDFARFSPGVLIQLENLNVLARGDIAWTDSCATEDHAMINTLWAERRTIVRVTVPLKGTRRRAAFALCRGLEKAAAMAKSWR